MNKKLLIFFILLTIIEFVAIVSASNVAYVVKSSGNLNIEALLMQYGMSYDIITQNAIPLADFSQYKVILVHGNVLNKDKIPFDSVNSLFIVDDTDPNNVLSFVWPEASVSSSGAIFAKLNQLGTVFAQGFSDVDLQAYDSSSAKSIYYLQMKPSYVTNIANSIQSSSFGKSIIAYSNENSIRDVFFGFSDVNYWSADTKKLFNNSMQWLMEGQCTDNDGDYYIVEKTDISLCKNVCGINHNESCIGNNDCNDNNNGVNPGEVSIFRNCRNDAPIIMDIDKITVSETQNATVTITALDPESNAMIYSINDTRFIQDNAKKNIFTWKTAVGDVGNYTFNISVGDGKLVSNILFYVDVLPKNKVPVCNNIPDLTWNEDESFSINLKDYCSDAESQQLIFSVYNKNGSNINVSLTNGAAVFSSVKDWNGNGDIIFKVSDGIDDNFTNKILLSINPVNDAPVFNGNINNFAFNENTNLTDAINLNNYFSDADSNLSFSVSGNSHINITINNGLVSFIPQRNWFGNESVVFSGSDGQYSADSNSVALNILDNNQPPLFDDFNCEMNILEDTLYNCELNGSDFENEILSFSVVSMNNIKCEINDTTLTYVSNKDYYGTGTCLLRVSDARGYSDSMFSIQIENVNDAPVITDYSPKNLSKIMNNTNQRFYLIDSDSDSITTIDWYLEYGYVGNGNNYVFNEDNGDYNLTVVVSDGEYETSREWDVKVRTINDFTCSEAHGYLCAANEICTGNILGVGNTNACCNVACSEKPPQFDGVKKCENKTSGIVINIKEPTNNQEFKIDAKINGELEIRNNNDQNKNFNIEAYLYDTTKEKSIVKIKDSLSINKNEMKTYNFVLDIPEDVNEKDKFAIYIKTYEKNNNSYCNDNYVKISLTRKDYYSKIESVNILPESLMCGDDIYADVKVNNIGNRGDTGHIKLESSELGISSQSEDFELISDKAEVKSIQTKISNSAKAGEYKLKAYWVSNNFNENSETSVDLTLGECKQEIIEQKSIETIKLNEENLPVIQNQENDMKLLFILEGVILLCILAIILIIIVILKRRKIISSGIGKAAEKMKQEVIRNKNQGVIRKEESVAKKNPRTSGKRFVKRKKKR